MRSALSGCRAIQVVVDDVKSVRLIGDAVCQNGAGFVSI